MGSNKARVIILIAKVHSFIKELDMFVKLRPEFKFPAKIEMAFSQMLKSADVLLKIIILIELRIVQLCP